MAKLSLNKLGLHKMPVVEKETFKFNEQEIEVIQYLPVNDKIDLIQRIVNASLDTEEKFINPCKVNVYMYVEIVLAYTNITLTETQKKDLNKVYDALCASHFIGHFRAYMNESEWSYITNTVWDVLDSMIKYRNSAVGILDTISQDYSNLDLDATEIQEKLADPNNMSLLKAVVDKLG